MKKKLRITLLSVSVLLIGSGVYWFQFNPVGFRMSVPLRSDYESIVENVFYDSAFRPHLTEAMTMLDQAHQRVDEFWSAVTGTAHQGNPYFIFSADKSNLEKLGGDHDAKSLWFPVHQSYISISDEYLNTDIVAHEMTHAELHARLSYSAVKKIPTWFDEGIALQNDYRSQYSEWEWMNQTDNGQNTVKPEDMDTPEEFYAGEVEDKRFRYLCAKHLVTQWLEANPAGTLGELIANLNDENGTFPPISEFTNPQQ
ncbi:MAG: hypothetical protein IK130_04410 [Oscillospiraceae bacterium]|nr:hypothetical protein [Oscillospiraceae bacterium]